MGVWKILNWPNRISLARVLMVGPFIMLLINQNEPGYGWARHVALGIFFLSAVSDFLDGQLARRLNQRTRLGAVLDPIADKMLIAAAIVLLALPGSAVPSPVPDGLRLPMWIVVAVLGKDVYVVVGFFVTYIITNRFIVQPTLAGKACTVGQLVMVLAVLAAPDIDRLTGALAAGTRLVHATWWIVLAMTLLAIASYTRAGLRNVVAADRPLEENSTGPKSVT
jgi:cardiolipin synthase (CMP-forming)